MVVKVNGFIGPQGFCYYCGREMTEWHPNLGVNVFTESRTKDHTIPRSRGGEKERIVFACRGCNQDKFHLTLEEYRVLAAYRAGMLAAPCPYKFAAEA